MKTTIYVLVTVALLAAIAMKLGYLDLSGGKAEAEAESVSAKPEPLAVVVVDCSLPAMLPACFQGQFSSLR